MTKDQVVGEAPSEIVPRDLAEIYEARDAAALKQGQQNVVEERLEHAGGDDEKFLTVRFPTSDRDGNITGLGLIPADITDWKLAKLG